MKGCGNRSNSHDTVQLGYATLFFDTLEYMERNQRRSEVRRGERRNDGINERRIKRESDKGWAGDSAEERRRKRMAREKGKPVHTVRVDRNE